MSELRMMPGKSVHELAPRYALDALDATGDYCRADSGTIHGETFTETGCLFLLLASQDNQVVQQHSHTESPHCPKYVSLASLPEIEPAPMDWGAARQV